MSIFDSFVKKHDYLVCVDSDGCVMDTMNCKHFHCFGPCMVTEWGLEQWQDAILILRDVFCGVVPMEAETRAWRQKTGRLAQYLSKEATQVSRIFCGLEQRLK